MTSRQDFPEVEIGYSSAKLLLLTGAGVLMTLASAAIAFNWFHADNIDTSKMTAGYFAGAFFGLATCVAGRKLMSSGRPVVVISRDGIRDLRISDELIPWESVEAISSWQYSGQKSMVLEVEPSVAERLNTSSVRRFFTQVNKTLGIDGVIISSAGLAVDVDALIETCIKYRVAAGPSHPAAF